MHKVKNISFTNGLEQIQSFHTQVVRATSDMLKTDSSRDPPDNIFKTDISRTTNDNMLRIWSHRVLFWFTFTKCFVFLLYLLFKCLIRKVLAEFSTHKELSTDWYRPGSSSRHKTHFLQNDAGLVSTYVIKQKQSTEWSDVGSIVCHCINTFYRMMQI